MSLCVCVRVQVASTSRASCPVSSVTVRRETSGRACQTCPPDAAGWASLLQWSRVQAAWPRPSRRRAEPRRDGVEVQPGVLLLVVVLVVVVVVVVVVLLFRERTLTNKDQTDKAQTSFHGEEERGARHKQLKRRHTENMVASQRPRYKQGATESF